MIEIIVGTNRSDARSKVVADIILKMYRARDVDAQIIDLSGVQIESSQEGHSYKAQEQSLQIQQLIKRVKQSLGLVIVCPEYNGSYPGILKYFIDHWSYPESFESRPVAFIGLGGRFGGLRPVEHLQGVFGYRNSFIFPERVFLFNVWDQIKNGELPQESMDILIKQQEGFIRFIEALKAARLSAGHREEDRK